MRALPNSSWHHFESTSSHSTATNQRMSWIFPPPTPLDLLSTPCLLHNMNHTLSYGRHGHARLSTVMRSLQIWAGNQKQLWLVTDPITTNWEWGPWSAYRYSTAHSKTAAVWVEALSIFFDTRAKPFGYFEIAAVKWIGLFCHFHTIVSFRQFPWWTPLKDVDIDCSRCVQPSPESQCHTQKQNLNENKGFVFFYKTKTLGSDIPW